MISASKILSILVKGHLFCDTTVGSNCDLNELNGHICYKGYYSYPFSTDICGHTVETRLLCLKLLQRPSRFKDCFQSPVVKGGRSPGGQGQLGKAEWVDWVPSSHTPTPLNRYHLFICFTYWGNV